MKYASFGSISSGTLRDEDLLSAFSSELEYQVQRNAEAWCSDEGRAQRDRYLRLVDQASNIFDEDGESIREDTDLDASELVAELQEALEEFAPPYAYFGAHMGDGVDFGYWLSDSLEYDFDGLKVDDTSEVPADYSGEVLHVNDHGNVTLYVANAGDLTEVWTVV